MQGIRKGGPMQAEVKHALEAQPMWVSAQPTAVTAQRSAVTDQPMAVTDQPMGARLACN